MLNWVENFKQENICTPVAHGRMVLKYSKHNFQTKSKILHLNKHENYLGFFCVIIGESFILSRHFLTLFFTLNHFLFFFRHCFEHFVVVVE